MFSPGSLVAFFVLRDGNVAAIAQATIGVFLPRQREAMVPAAKSLTTAFAFGFCAF